jgi:uncharacterized membrane protein YqhA
MNRLLTSTRYVMYLGIATLLLLSLSLFALGAIHGAMLVVEHIAQFSEAKTAKAFAIASIDLADLFLIATALYIVGIGLYELFIGGPVLPGWLKITSLDDLKDKLISVSIVVIAIAFVSQIVNWDGQSNLLPYGAAIALVVFALTAFRLVQRSKKADSKPAGPEYGDRGGL